MYFIPFFSIHHSWLSFFFLPFSFGVGGSRYIKCLPVVCMYGATFKSSNCMLNKSRFVQGVSMDVDLHFRNHNHFLTCKTWLNQQTQKGTSTWMSYWSATARHISIAAGVVPQSSWSFRPIAPALIISCKPSALELLPCKTIGQRNKCTGNRHTTLLEHLMDFKLDKPPMHYTKEISIKSSVYAQHREHRNKDLLFHLLVTIVGKKVKRSASLTLWSAVMPLELTSKWKNVRKIWSYT